MRAVFIASVVAFVVSLFGTPFAIRLFIKLKAAQPIRTDAPVGPVPPHEGKRGTPTMGGVVFIVATVVAYVIGHLALMTLPVEQIAQVTPTITALVLLGLFVFCGAVGFIDDLLKVRKRNSGGLSKRGKLLGQLLVGAAFGVVALYYPSTNDQTVGSTKVSFIKDIDWLDIGKVGAVILFVFIIIATSNAVNITDGLDGLATGTSVMVLSAFSFIGAWQYQHWCGDRTYATPTNYCYEVRDPLEIALICAAAAGACVGFLWWNASPARIFMGDTGALGLGGLIGGAALATRTELLLPIIGGLFVILMGSVIIQMVSYKTTGKRVFRMSPLQHHFELVGWSEVNIVIRFWIIGGLCVALGLGIFYSDFLRMMPVKYLVVGARVAGAASALALHRLGHQVLVVDKGSADPALEAAGIEVIIGDPDPAQLLSGVDEVVLSPGIPPHHQLPMAALAKGLDVYSEPELAWRLRGPDAPIWLAITGTNGKTTTTTMLASILRAAGLRSAALGNIGVPLVDAQTGYDVLAVELSSFQLHWSSTLAPQAGAMLNLADDHLDWHGGFDAYAKAKTAIWRGGVAVGNLDDPRVAEALEQTSGRKIGFTLGVPPAGCTGLVEDLLIDRINPGDAFELANVADIKPSGFHNVANALAASALALSIGVSHEAIRAGLTDYVPEPHRNAPVATVNEVSYVDDSKATNPHAALASLLAYQRIVWVAGGQLKGVEIDDLVARIAPRLAGAVVLGVDRAQVLEALSRHAPRLPVVEVSRTDDGAMGEVVSAAARMAVPGDTVLLAPAAASLDMFASYAHRGGAFASAVRGL